MRSLTTRDKIAELPADKLRIVEEALVKSGGLAAFKPGSAADSLATMLRLIFSTPEFQMC